MPPITLEPCDLIFVKGTGPIQTAIEDITHSSYSHVALVADSPSTLLEAQGFRRIGTQDPDIYEGCSDIYRCPTLTEAQKKRILNYALSCEGQTYDYGLIFVEFIRYMFGVMLPWYEYHGKICSTYVTDAFRATGIDPCPSEIYPTPADLATSPVFIRLGAFT